ncbi:CBS and ACT domain-containing protein [Motiliproteus sp. SC1-56]|uniref:CBS and ACT domain-containing protein n=1 Tax=Motiliproteus sp. SC1-56 TaxID=2799565 RepID=UPI001A8C5729|nr:CBS and ACT domain-containing protein [Motiliproteus sp. SC1-56]
MYVETIMTTEVLTVEEGTRMSHLAGLMQARRIRHMPVVDGDGALKGIISHRDVQKASPSDITTLSTGEVNYLLSQLTAKDIMHRSVTTCTPDTLVEDAACLMREQTIGCLPVVKEGKLVGILTGVDLLDFFLDITGCRSKDASRICIRLEDRQGVLSKLLGCLSELGGYVVSVMTPQNQSPGVGLERQVIVRYRADNPRELNRQLQERGYELLSAELPEG